MARSSTARVQTIRPVVIAAPAPVRRRSSGGGRRRRSSGGKRRRRGSSRGSSYSLKGRMLGAGAGGFGVGFIEKNFGAQIPTIPIIGKKGAIALAAYYFAPKHPLIQDVGIAAAALAGYEFGMTGKVTGDVIGHGGYEGMAAEAD